MLTDECYRSWDAALWRTDKERPLGAVVALSMLEDWCGREGVPFRHAAPHDGSDDRGTPG
jgi:hypothetical protein